MISPKDTILISGDSWGCGEWGPGPSKYGAVHNGLEYFLTEYGCKVINVSVPASANVAAIKRLKNALNETTPDCIFWFQTSPIRDLRPYEENEELMPKNANEYNQIHKELLNSSYESLNNLGVKIHCMGGVSPLLDDINNYSNLISFIPSIIKMFGGKDPKYWIGGWVDSRVRLDPEFLTELEELSEPQDLLPKKWFYPDGIHPNRHAHYKIFEYILEQHK